LRIADGSNVCLTTATITDGALNLLESGEARTITTLNPDGGEITMNDDVITVTNFDQPAGAAVSSAV